MTEDIVHFTHAVATDAGAVPVGTHVATHNRAGDSAEVQDVYIDGATHANVHTGSVEVRTFSEGHICAENSSNVPLGINATFTGAWQDTLDYSEVITTIYTDKNSVTDGMKIWWSADGITVDPDPDTFTITANISKTFSFPCNRRFVKITYQNDGTAQTIMMLSTALKRFASKGSSHRLKDTLNQEDDAIVTKTLIAGKTTAAGGAIVDVKVNPSGTLTVDATGSAVSVTNSILPTGAATSAAQTDGSQIAKIYFAGDQVSLDAGGILRVGQQSTLFDGKILNADDLYLWENAGTGTGVFGTNKYNMSVTSGQWSVKQSRRRTPYFSGKSQRIEATFDKFAPQANITKRVGYFSSNAVSPFDSVFDGFWLESAGGIITLKAARAGTETLSVAITAWTGYSKLLEYQTLSTWDFFTVCEFKFLWLGGAVLVLNVKTSNGFVEAHRFNYSGTAADLFILSPNQPVRYEIRSTTGTGDFRAICSQVATEGSVDESGEGLAVMNTASITTNAVGTIYALMGMKKQTTYRDNAIQITDIAISNSSVTSDVGIMMLIINPTISAALTYGNNSKLQIALATNQTITAGTGRIIAASPIASSAGGAEALNKNFLSWLSSTLNNTHDEYVLAYMPTTATQSVFGVVNLKEY